MTQRYLFKHNQRITMREAAATLIGAALMTSIMCLGSWLDHMDKVNEEETIRLAAAKAGFEEGMTRVQCMGGLRYDRLTGHYVDIAKVGPTK